MARGHKALAIALYGVCSALAKQAGDNDGVVLQTRFALRTSKVSDRQAVQC